MLRPGRKQHIKRFSISHNPITVILLGLLFLIGLAIAWQHSLGAALAYLGLWAVSYPVIYAGTCRYCAYYGNKCPIPLEGSCVHYFFEKKNPPFGLSQLLWATIAYALRVILPVIFIFKYEMTGWGIAFFAVLGGFWVVHLRFSGCPNCINTQCPLNPGPEQREVT